MILGILLFIIGIASLVLEWFPQTVDYVSWIPYQPWVGLGIGGFGVLVFLLGWVARVGKKKLQARGVSLD